MSYTLTQKEYSNLKRRLTRVINKMTAAGGKDKVAAAKKVIAECDHAESVFEEKGFPDFWMNWQRAKEDAQWLIQRSQTTWS